jgi:hypothetical protein
MSSLAFVAPAPVALHRQLAASEPLDLNENGVDAAQVRVV